MYNDAIKQNILDNLESKTINVTNTAVVLASQGYLVNKSKYIKLDWSSILIHAFENIDVFNAEQQQSIERLYNEYSAL